MNATSVRVVSVNRNVNFDAARLSLAKLEVRRHDGGTVNRIQRSLASERQWTQAGKGPAGTHYEGYFVASGRRFPGKATLSRSDLDLFVRNVPEGLKRHPEWQCFRARSDGWFWVHHTRQASLDAAILEIEAIFTEAIQLESGGNARNSRSRETSLPPWILGFAKLLRLQ